MIYLRYFKRAHFIPLIVGVETERHTLVGPWECIGSPRYWDYLEDYWCRAGISSAVNAISMQMLGQINLGLTRWRMVA